MQAEEEKEGHEEEYELIAMSPVRRLEKRVETIEKGSGVDAKEFMREIVDIVRMNQQIVDEMAKSNDALRIELSKLPGRIEELVGHLNELLSYIKASAAEDTPAANAMKPVADKLDVLIDMNKKLIETNQGVVSNMEEMEKKMKRPLQPPGLQQRRQFSMAPRPLPAAP